MEPGSSYEAVSDLRQTSKYLTASDSGSAYLNTVLVDGETLTLTVPQNAVYTVLEEAGDYISSYQITDSNGLNLVSRSADANTEKNKSLSTQPETADDGEDITVEFINERDVRQNLTITKTLENASEGNYDLFDFTLNINFECLSTALLLTIPICYGFSFS